MRATALLALYGPDIAITEARASIEVDEGGNDSGWTNANQSGARSITGY